MEADNVRKKGTGRTGLGLIAIAIGIIAAIALIVYALMIPGVFASYCISACRNQIPGLELMITRTATSSEPADADTVSISTSA